MLPVIAILGFCWNCADFGEKYLRPEEQVVKSPLVKQEEEEPICVKEEVEDDVTKSPLTFAPFKSNDEVMGESEEDRGAEPPSSSSTLQHMETEGASSAACWDEDTRLPRKRTRQLFPAGPKRRDRHARVKEGQNPRPHAIKPQVRCVGTRLIPAPAFPYQIWDTSHFFCRTATPVGSLSFLLQGFLAALRISLVPAPVFCCLRWDRSNVLSQHNRCHGSDGRFWVFFGHEARVHRGHPGLPAVSLPRDPSCGSMTPALASDPFAVLAAICQPSAGADAGNRYAGKTCDVE
ncbi:uncharacterized protein LOC144043451 isoform X2 [Vanacampus margaritifer]